MDKAATTGIRALTAVANTARRAMSSKKKPVLVVGNGSMGGSVIDGLHKGSYNITVVSPTPPNKPLPGVTYHLTPEDIEDNQKFSTILFAVKPALAQKIIPQYSDKLKEDGVVVSVLAGTTVDTIARSFPKNTAVVRAMPNLGATVRSAMTGLFAVNATEGQKKEIEQLMESIGEILWVKKEEDINKITAVSGSGPAYFFEFMRAFIEVAKSEFGFTEEEATKLVINTAFGAADLAKHDKRQRSVTELRETVRSPQGTTDAGLKQLMEDNKLEQMLQKTLEAAFRRAKELAVISAAGGKSEVNNNNTDADAKMIERAARVGLAKRDAAQEASNEATTAASSVRSASAHAASPVAASNDKLK